MELPAVVEGLCILVLDHGDVRAFSQLEILGYLLYNIGFYDGEEHPNPDLAPL